MKIKTSDLRTALEHLKPAVGKAAMLPILTCVKISTDGNGTLVLDATDLDQYITENIPCDGVIDEFCVNFRALENVIGGEEMNLDQEGEFMVFKCSYGSARVGFLDAEEFPKVPKFVRQSKIGISCPDLADSIKQVLWAAFHDDARYILRSVHVRASSKMLVTEATNGRNLAVVSLPVISAECETIIPEQFCANLCSALGRDGAVFSVSDKHVIVEHASGLFCCKLVEGNYPNTKHVIPAKPELLGEADVAELVEGFSRCNFFADPSRTPVAILEFGKDGLDVSFSGRNSQLEIHAAGKFKKGTANMSADAFLLCLKGLGSEKVKISQAEGMMVLEAGNLSIFTTTVKNSK